MYVTIGRTLFQLDAVRQGIKLNFEET